MKLNNPFSLSAPTHVTAIAFVILFVTMVGAVLALTITGLAPYLIAILTLAGVFRVLIYIFTKK